MREGGDREAGRNERKNGGEAENEQRRRKREVKEIEARRKEGKERRS